MGPEPLDSMEEEEDSMVAEVASMEVAEASTVVADFTAAVAATDEGSLYGFGLRGEVKCLHLESGC